MPTLKTYLHLIHLRLSRARAASHLQTQVPPGITNFSSSHAFPYGRTNLFLSEQPVSQTAPLTRVSRSCPDGLCPQAYTGAPQPIPCATSHPIPIQSASPGPGNPPVKPCSTGTATPPTNVAQVCLASNRPCVNSGQRGPTARARARPNDRLRPSSFYSTLTARPRPACSSHQQIVVPAAPRLQAQPSTPKALDTRQTDTCKSRPSPRTPDPAQPTKTPEHEKRVFPFAPRFASATRLWRWGVASAFLCEALSLLRVLGSAMVRCLGAGGREFASPCLALREIGKASWYLG